MNTPTTCMACDKVFPIEDCWRDPEGNWFCKSCFCKGQTATLDGLKKVGPNVNWFEDFLRKARAAGDVKETRVNVKALEEAAEVRVVDPSAFVTTAHVTPELLAHASEDEWQQVVRSCAAENGWTCYHTRDSRGSDPGFPDQVMGKIWTKGRQRKRCRLIHAELKTEVGSLSEAQRMWRDLIVASGGRYYVWRPRDWPAVKEVLSEI